MASQSSTPHHLFTSYPTDLHPSIYLHTHIKPKHIHIKPKHNHKYIHIHIHIKQIQIYTSFQAGGVQVDLMFMVSGFLLVKKLLEQYKEQRDFDVISTSLERAKRLLPTIVVVCMIAVGIGDSWDAGKRVICVCVCVCVCVYMVEGMACK